MKAPIIRVACVVGTAAALILASCTSLPLSSTAEQSLVVFPLDVHTINRSGPGSVTQSVTLVLLRERDRREIPIRLNLKSTYATVALDPGAYQGSRIEIRRAWRGQNGSYGNPWIDKQWLSRDLAFYVVPRIVLLQERVFIYNDNQFGDGYSCHITSALQQTPEVKRQLLAELKSDSHWPGWEGYKLVNFAVP